MEFVAMWYEYDVCNLSGLDWTCMIYRSIGNIKTMNPSMFDVPTRISTTKLSTTPKVVPVFRSPKRITR